LVTSRHYRTNIYSKITLNNEQYSRRQQKSTRMHSQRTNLRRSGFWTLDSRIRSVIRIATCITWSLCHALPLHKISSKSVHKFASNPTDRQTNRPHRKHNLLLSAEVMRNWSITIKINSREKNTSNNNNTHLMALCRAGTRKVKPIGIYWSKIW